MIDDLAEWLRQLAIRITSNVFSLIIIILSCIILLHIMFWFIEWKGRTSGNLYKLELYYIWIRE